MTATTATATITPTDTRSTPGSDLDGRDGLAGGVVAGGSEGAGRVGGATEAAWVAGFSVPQFGHRHDRVDGSMWNRFPHERQVANVHVVPHDTHV
jgi:hypothetical protein